MEEVAELKERLICSPLAPQRLQLEFFRPPEGAVIPPPSLVHQVLRSEDNSERLEMPWPSRKRDKGAVAGLC